MVDPDPPPVRPASCEQCGKSLDSADSGSVCASCLIDLAKARWLDPSPSLESAFSVDSLRCLTESSSHDSPATSPLRDSRFGDYELLDEIARGGMGIVFRARQISLNRIVAIKMIRAGVLASELDIVRFQAEAQAAARLQHPNIIAIHEVGEHDDRHYFSMAYVPGQNLAQCVREHPWAAPRAAHCLARIAEAVHYAHEHGILHRDLKPSNVIIDEEDTPHLTDFGLATRIEDASALTLSGAILGTPSYMAPEQTGGRRFEIGPRTDIYALGALLYEVLTGHPPFQGETPLDTIKLVRETDPVPPRRLNPRIPADLETITLKCLEKEPRKRYSTAREFAEDLTRFLANQPIHARPARAWEIAGKWIHRNPWRAALAVSASLALIVTSAFWLEIIANRRLADLNLQLTDALGREQEQRIRAENADRETRAAMAELEKAREVANRAQYQTRIAEAQQAIAANSLAEAERLLDLCSPEQRKWEWHYLRKFTQTESARYSLSTRPIRSITISGDGSRAAAIDDTGHIRHLHIASRRISDWFERPPTELLNIHVSSIALPSSKDWLFVGATNEQGSLRAFSTNWPKQPVLFDTVRSIPVDLVLSSDDRFLLRLGAEGLSCWATDSGSKLWKVPCPEGLSGIAVAMSRDATTAAWILYEPEYDIFHRRLEPRGSAVFVHSAADGTLLRKFPEGLDDIRSIALDPAGHQIAIGHGSGRIQLWDLATGRPTGSLRGHNGPVVDLCFDLPNSRLASAGSDREVKIWNLETAGESSVFRGNRAEVRRVAFAPDGNAIISAANDGSVRVWEINSTPHDQRFPSLYGESVAFLDDTNVVTSTGEIISSLKGLQSPSVVCNVDHARVSLHRRAGLLTIGPSLYKLEREDLLRPVWTNFGPVVAYAGAEAGVYSAISACGEFVATGNEMIGKSKKETIRRVSDASVLNTLIIGTNLVYDLCFNQSNTLLAVSTGSWARNGYQGDGEPGILQLWDWKTPRLVRSIHSTRFCIWSAAFTPDGGRVVTVGGLYGGGRRLPPKATHGEIQVWDVATGSLIFDLPGVFDNVFSVAISPDGSRLAAPLSKRSSQGPPGEVKLWDLDTGAELLALRGFSGVLRGVAFSPNGKRLAAIGPNILRIWSID